MMWARRQGVAFAATLLAIAAGALWFPQAVPSARVLLLNTWTVLGMASFERDAYFARGAGEAVLPIQVQMGLALIRERQVRDFDLTEDWMADPYLDQRITESAFPAMRSFSSKNIIGTPEKLPAACTEIRGYRAQQGGAEYAVVLGRCP